jgi:hypothetical protein
MIEMTLKEEAKKAHNEHMADYRLGLENFLKLCDKYGWKIMEEVVTEYRREHPELRSNDGTNGNLE